MKANKITRRILIGLLVVGFGMALPNALRKNSMNNSLLQALYEPTLYESVSANCGGCHANKHFTSAGGYRLDNGANTHAGGVVAQTRGIDPTAMTNGDPLTSLIIQKPLALTDGSSTLHGGIKLPINHPTIQKLIAWVKAGAPSADMDPPPASAPTYYNTAAGQHFIVCSIRVYRRTGFRDMVGSAPGGNIYRIKFDGTTNAIIENTNLTNLPATDDAESPTVSLDGTKVAFARKQPGQPWQIWEIGIDGSGLRQITNGSGDKVQPFYLPYNADGSAARSGEGGVGFVSNKAGFRDEYETSSTLSLYVCDTDGNNLRQIDFNPSHDVHPWLNSSGVLVFTRWEHNEHQGHNFMPLFAICASDIALAGTNLFAAYGEHFTSPAGNSLHEASEVYYSGVPSGYMMARGSNRDDAGGSIVGFIHAIMEGDVGSAPRTNVIAEGDNDSMKPMTSNATPLGYTFRNPRSLLQDLFVVSRASMTGSVLVTNEFNGKTSTKITYGNFELYTFNVTGNPPTLTNLKPLLAVNGYNVDEVVPVLVKPTPPRIGKPIDLTKNTGFFTSGNIRERQNDGQPTSIDLNKISEVRFIRALQFSQGTVNTGRRNDRGIATQIVGGAPISSDGSFFAEVPSQVPMQFQLLDKNGRQVVTHKPWVQVAPGETMRCVGCHANHSAVPSVQTLEARQAPAHQVDTRDVRQFHFNKDIQKIFNAHCVQCHDSAKVTGAPGRNRSLSLTGRFTPANRTEAFESLVGVGMSRGEYVVSQNSNQSPLIWWLTGFKNDGSKYPVPEDKVAHNKMLNESELTMIEDWINTGVNFRVVDDHIPSKLSQLDAERFKTEVWPILQSQCLACHSKGAAGGLAMNLDGDPEEAESQEEVDENRLEAFSAEVNFIRPDASMALRKPLGERLGGVSHVGGQFFTDTNDPQYVTIYKWIAAANPALAPGVPPTDLINVTNYPNPFRDTTNLVYGLTGAVAARIEIQIFSQSGKLIRELTGPANTSTTVGWNRVEWDGKDKNGKTVGNDVYFYMINATFGDGTKKVFKGKCVKVN